jgi:outer membrane lipase/esterase
MKYFHIRPAVLAATALAIPVAASAAGPSQFIGFGDSTMDSGYFRYESTAGSPGLPGISSRVLDGLIAQTVAAGGSGAFVGPGIVDTVQLATRFGLTALPSTIPGGTNYANGSAQTLATTASNLYAEGLYNNVPIVTQIYTYLDQVHGRANPAALYMVSYGGNDLAWLENQAPASLSPQAYLQSLANGLTAGVSALQAAGGRTIVVLDVYAYARLVGPGGSLTAANATDLANATFYSAQVWSGLAAAHVNFVPADVEGVLRYASQNPARFGFTPDTVLAGSPACGTTSSILCAPSALVTPNAEQTYLWSDVHHLTTAGQTLEADYIYSLLTAPSEISLLAESAVQTGLARVASIQGQIDLSGEHRGPNGINVWASAGAGSLGIDNAAFYPTISGVPFGGSIGADYLTPIGVIVGGAVSAGDQTQNFSTGGYFGQVNEVLSLYAGYRTGPLWGDAVAGYGFLQNHVARQVPIGQFTDQNNGYTDGHDWAFALRGGYDFHAGVITTGPVVGLVLQRVGIDGFTETGTTGVTALGFGSQTRNSAVTQLGWRGSAELGAWQPFGEVAWNHELAGHDRTETVSLTSIAAPSYTASAAPVASDWASLSLGVAYRLNRQVTLRGAGFADVWNPQVGTYGGEVGLNVGF